MSQLFQSGHPDADQLSAFAENALPPHEREALLAHLAVCADCREVVREVVTLSLPPMETTPAVPERRPWFSGMRLLWPAAALASAAVLLVFAHRVAVSGRGAGMPNQVAEVHPPPAPTSSANAPQPIAPPAAPSPKPVVPGQPAKQPAGQPLGGVMGGLSATPQPAIQTASGGVPTAVDGQPILESQMQAEAAPLPAQAQRGAIRGELHGAANGSGAGMAAQSTASFGNSITQAAQNSTAQPSFRVGLEAGVGGAAPQAAPAAIAAAPKPEAAGMEAASDVSALDSLSDAASDAIIAPVLPSGAAVLSTAVRGRQIVAIDTKNAVFVSNDGGVHWVPVAVPWKGRAVRAQLISSTILGRAMAFAPVANASRNPMTATGSGAVASAGAAAKSINAAAAPPPVASLSPSPGPPGSLSGTVTDPVGAIITNANITLTGAGGAVLKTVKTGPDGQYRIDGVPPGTYDLNASAPGFRMATLPAVPVAAAAEGIKNLTLKVGASTETVTVESQSLALQTESTSINTGITAPSLPQLFAITTDTGERWTSSDGITWRHQ